MLVATKTTMKFIGLLGVIIGECVVQILCVFLFYVFFFFFLTRKLVKMLRVEDVSSVCGERCRR